MYRNTETEVAVPSDGDGLICLHYTCYTSGYIKSGSVASHYTISGFFGNFCKCLHIKMLVFLKNKQGTLTSENL